MSDGDLEMGKITCGGEIDALGINPTLIRLGISFRLGLGMASTQPELKPSEAVNSYVM
jgi:hypothetical protein